MDGTPELPSQTGSVRILTRLRNNTQRLWKKCLMHAVCMRVVCALLGGIIAGIWVGTVIYFGQRQRQHILQSKISGYAKSRHGGTKDAPEGEYIPYYQAALRQFDPDSRELAVQWSVVYTNSSRHDSAQFYGPSEEYSTPAFLHRDVDTVLDVVYTKTWWTEAEPYLYYMLDNRTTPRLGTVGEHGYDGVTTAIDMAVAEANSDRVWIQPTFGYPWDQWAGSIVLTMTDIALDENRELNQSEIGYHAWSTYGVTVIDNIINWDIDYDYRDLCLETEDRAASGMYAQMNGTELIDSGFEGQCQMEVTFYARRPGITRFVVLLIIVINWIITIAIFIMTCEAVILRRKQVLKGTDMLAVCFTSLFALPTIRSLLPGAPAQFGALIDFVGILPNLVSISLCATFFAIEHIRARQSAESEEVGPNKLRDLEDSPEKQQDNSKITPQRAGI